MNVFREELGNTILLRQLTLFGAKVTQPGQLSAKYAELTKAIARARLRTPDNARCQSDNAHNTAPSTSMHKEKGHCEEARRSTKTIWRSLEKKH